MNNFQDCYTLNNGVPIPCIGFGTWALAREGSQTIAAAIEAGYRYFDTASFYGNEEMIGRALRESENPRGEFFLASKVWKTEMGYESTLEAFENSVRRLGTDYLDLYLIHWPLPDPKMPEEEWKELDAATWKAMEKLYKEEKVRAIGVSNFLPHHLEPLLDKCEIVPAVNQLELHPGYMQSAAVQFCENHDILLQAWSPLGRKRVMNLPLLIELAEKYRVSTARISLRFLHQSGCLPLPKASTPERMKDNQNIFDFTLSREDMYRIATLPQAGWSGEHPDYERIEN